MAKINLILDVPDELLRVFNTRIGNNISLEDALRAALMCWVERHTPLTFSAKLDKTEIVECVLDYNTLHIENDVEKERVMEVIRELYHYLDKYLDKLVSPQRLIVSDGFQPHGGSFLIRLNDMVF